MSTELFTSVKILKTRPVADWQPSDASEMNVSLAVQFFNKGYSNSSDDARYRSLRESKHFIPKGNSAEGYCPPRLLFSRQNSDKTNTVNSGPVLLRLMVLSENRSSGVEP